MHALRVILLIISLLGPFVGWACDQAIGSSELGEILRLSRQINSIVHDLKVDGPARIVNRAVNLSERQFCKEVEVFSKANNLSLSCPPQIRLRAFKQPEFLQDLLSSRAALRTLTPGSPAYHYHSSRLQTLKHPRKHSFDWSSQGNNKGKLEIWLEDNSGVLHLFKTMNIHELSGIPGPKIQQRDEQVPEGTFRLSATSRDSSYFTNVHIEYEKWSDRGRLLATIPSHLTKRTRSVGGLIKIHGHGGSVGCLDMGNIQAAYINAAIALAHRHGHEPSITILPFALSDENFQTIRNETNLGAYIPFWRALRADDAKFFRSPSQAASLNQLIK